jgi:CO/xanthine dehydrogenase Mo-binding subunit
LTDGVVDQSNFDSYEPLRISDMPFVEVHIIGSTAPPTGIGDKIDMPWFITANIACDVMRNVFGPG